MINTDFEPSFSRLSLLLGLWARFNGKACVGMAWKEKAAWEYMDYAAHVKTISNGNDFTYAEYSRLKRKPPKVKTKSETKTGNVREE